jgi:hypothetical protein
MKHRNVPRRIRLIGFMCPCVHSTGSGMPCEVKYFYYSVPDGFPVELLMDWHAFNVCRLGSMQPPDDVAQFLDIAHDTASTKSPTVQKSFSTPAAIAGVQRSVA